MPDERIVNNGYARCGICGTPAVAALGTTIPAELEAHPMIEVRCHGCAMLEAAERITSEASGGDTDAQ